MGAATRPPVCSLAPSWPSMITDTATCGGCPGGPAKAMIQAWERAGVVPSCAVPVFAPISTPGPPVGLSGRVRDDEERGRHPVIGE